MNESVKQRPRLYYDSACPVCRREIALVRRLSRQLDYVDVHALSDRDLPEGLTRDAMLRDLHLRDGDGTWFVGLSANTRLWQYTPLAPLWRTLTLPLVRPIAERLYRWWADRRYRRMGYCGVGSKPK